MALEQFCASCTYLKEYCDSYGKYWCERKGEDHYACDARCYSWCEAYSRSDSCRQNMYDNSKSHSGGGCYLTTAMCDILGYQDNNYYLQTLRLFRDTVLQKNRSYWPLLIAYDIVGPSIARELSEDKNNVAVATEMFDNYITKAVTAIETKKYEQATNIYIDMTNSLANRYGFEDVTSVIIDSKDTEVKDPSLLGHAKKRVLKQN